MTEAMREYQRVYASRHRVERFAQGRCRIRSCSSPIVPDRQLCAAHLEARRQAERAKAAARAAADQCVTCGKPRDRAGALCEACRARVQAFVTERIAKGLCRKCGAVRSPGYRVHCEPCDAYYRETAWRAARILGTDSQPLRMGEFRAKLQKQGGQCALMGVAFACVARLDADHDHETGIFRGVVCHKHNLNIVGRHTAATVAALARYLAGRR